MTSTAEHDVARGETEPPDGDTHLTHCSDLFDEFLIRIGRVQREYARAVVEQTVRHGGGGS
ncbi:hypothetical protein [Streptomyces sp. NPDC047000]|uniref:hypothetical protein n=1 Tax=Streptomyces sp. NPDC047000 TaxID=3155474 RepID=UPI00340DCA19